MEQQHYPVIFAGAGPGDKDLITVKALNAVRSAQVIVYAGSLINGEILEEAPFAEKFNSADLSLDQVIRILAEAYAQGKRVLRLHTGDPAIYGAVAEQFRELDLLGIPYEVIPGVSSVFAAAAALKTEFTMNGVTQTAILTRFAGRTPVPESENAASLASHGSTLCFFLSAAGLDGLAADLIRGGRSEDTPAAVVYKASWPDEKIVRGTLKDIGEKTRLAGIRRQAMIVVGDVLRREGDCSCLYDSKFVHGYRRKVHEQFRGRVALLPVTVQGYHKAVEISSALACSEIWIPEAFRDLKKLSCVRVRKTSLMQTVKEIWSRYDAVVFLCASGIAVRAIAALCSDKERDPAVVLCDESGDFAVSLTGGHTAGANLLAEQIAGVTGGQAVITAASDKRHLPALDHIAARNQWRILNREMIVKTANCILSGQRLDVSVPQEIYDQYFASYPDLFRRVESPAHIESAHGFALLGYGERIPEETLKQKILFVRPKSLVLGIGCRKGVTAEQIAFAVNETLKILPGKLEQVCQIATIPHKCSEEGLADFCRTHHIPLRGYPIDRLKQCDVPNPSPKVRELFGIDSVCEAAAMTAAGTARLLLYKQKFPAVTAAAAEMADEKDFL